MSKNSRSPKPKRKDSAPVAANAPDSRPFFFLRTKLLPPRPSPELLSRPRLTDRILANLAHPATLITANAGSGKTTLVADFLRKSRREFVWYQLDHTDADPSVFIGYLTFGIQQSCPAFGKATFAYLREAQAEVSDHPEKAVDVFLEDVLDHIEQPLIVVLDDYHHLGTDTPVHAVLDRLLAYLPDFLHFIVISREFPPISMKDLRAGMSLSIIDQSALRLTEEEIQQLYFSVFDLHLTTKQVADYRQRTDGWFTAFQLFKQVALRTISQQQDVAELGDPIEILTKAERDIFDYFAEEVFYDEASETQHLLLRFSLLDSIELDACAVLFEGTDCARILPNLVRRNVFVTLGQEGHSDVYRLHPLFQRFLQKRFRSEVGRAGVALEHEKYADYFLERMAWEPAVKHLLAADQFDRAASVIAERGIRSSLAGELIEQADAAERHAREALAEFDYQEAYSLISSATNLDPNRMERLAAEFGFLLEPKTAPAEASSDCSDELNNQRWQTQIWRILSERNQFILSLLDRDEQASEENPIVGPADARTSETKAGPQTKTSAEDRGEQLEQAVVGLFEEFFRIGGESLQKLRQQDRGLQFGHDISFESVLPWDQTIRCHVECKNLSKSITLKDIADKLISQLHFDPKIDIWILISPLTNPSNELDQILEAWKSDPQYPFDIQIWCPATGVRELFGLQPLYYDVFFKNEDNSAHPRTWDQAKRSAVRERWRQKLQAPIRLPRGWTNYLRQPQFQCLHRESHPVMDATFANHVSMGCRNEAGVIMPQPLEHYVREWLERANQPVFFLLGEFGDGKSFFTYALTRRLTAEFLIRPMGSPIPLRLSLRDLWSAGNPREFLRRRLEEFGADLEGWTSLKAKQQLLIILDGFDEMSKELDPRSITRNIQALVQCYEEFEGCKVLITSRTHFFERRHDVSRLMTRLQNPVLYHLAPISRRTTEKHLQLIAEQNGLEQALARLRVMHDPIGLAAKPFFLQMLKDTLSNLPQDLNELTLYDQYIRNSLLRKAEQLDDHDLMTNREELIDNLIMILEAIAAELQVSQEEYVSLSRFAEAQDKNFAELLWKMTGSDDDKKDAQARIGIRSLLTRVQTPKMEEEWTVDFCHRSIREYFVARSISAALLGDLENALCVLKQVAFNHEIVEFASASLRKTNAELSRNNLLRLIEHATLGNDPGRLGGTALTLLYRISPHLPDADWSGKVFDFVDLEGADLSGMTFSNSSLRFADLTNANLENAHFENCDFTGVRIEETAPVVSLASHPSQDRILAIYKDGTALEWNLKHPRKSEARLVASDLPLSGTAFGIQMNGDMWLSTAGEFRFLHLDEKNPMAQLARFPVKSSYRVATPTGRDMLIIEDSGDGSNRILLIDLSAQRIISTVRTADVTLCAALEADCFLMNDTRGGLQLIQLTKNESSAVSITNELVTCLATFCLQERLHLVVYGQSDGLVEAWSVDLKYSPAYVRKLVSQNLHSGPVTAVSFFGESRIISGGRDRAIVVSRFDSQVADGQTVTERKLQLTMRCKGMRINGLKGPEELTKLAELIRKAECEISV